VDCFGNKRCFLAVPVALAGGGCFGVLGCFGIVVGWGGAWGWYCGGVVGWAVSLGIGFVVFW